MTQPHKPGCLPDEPKDFQFKVNGEDCSVCGIRAFDHYHPDKTKAKEFTMTEYEGPDPRAEENCPGEHCVYSSFEICPFDGSIHAPTPRGWEEQFDDEKLKSLLGGYCWGQDGGNGGYDYSDIKSFIASEIEKAVLEERKKIAARVNNADGYGFCCSSCQSRIIEKVCDIINPK